MAEVACVGEAATEGADEEEEEDLEGADPGYVRRRAAEKSGVVGLKDAEGVDDAPAICVSLAGCTQLMMDLPGIHNDQMGAEDCGGN